MAGLRNESRMTDMKKRFSIVSAVLMVLGFGLVGWARAQDYEGPMSALRFVVVRDYNGKPVRDAAVVLHPVDRKGKQSRGGMELKTDTMGGRVLMGFRMVRCGCRCWRRVFRLLGKTTRSTSRSWRLR